MSSIPALERSNLSGEELVRRNGFILVPLENFKPEPLDFSKIGKTVVSIYLDGFFVRERRCSCPSRMLLESGCQCGGV